MSTREITNDPLIRRGMRAFLQLISLAEPLCVDFWRSHELTLMQVRCLRLLKDAPLPAGDLARRLGLSPASMTRLLERLESRALLVRQADVQDRRRVLVSLTETGTAMTGSFDFWLKTPAVDAFYAMTPDEQERVAASLEILVQQLAVKMAEADQAEPGS
jgi:DNA-binding MarR family transcriptional regulator